MKKSFLALILKCLPLLLISSGVYSQKAAINSTFDSTQSLHASVTFKKPVNSGIDNTTTWNSINTRAIREFKKSFKDVNNEQWYETSKVYVATFFQNNIKNRVVYGKKGNWLYTIRYYTEKELPRDIRAIVKRTYYDYTITQIEEVHQEGNIVYIVHLEDETGWINVSVCNGEMGIMKQFKK